MLARINQTKVFGRIPLPIFVGLVIGGITLLILVLILANIDAVALWVQNAILWVFNPDLSNVIECSESQGCSILHPIIYSALLLFVVITGFAYTTLLERKFIAYFQQRVGPNRVGPGGFLQPAADGVKLIFKEDIEPAEAYKWVYRIAPMLKAVPTLIVLAVIPLGPPIIIPWLDGNWYRVPLQVADPNVGVLWLVAITSIATYGVALAGWASNNKYAMLGALRATAQMISYELSLGLALVVPVMIAGSMSVKDIVDAQAGTPLNWFVFQNPLAAAILIVALIAEVNRAPFDLPEAEQELTAGFMTEYSGMKFALFMMAEYLGMIAVSLIAMSAFFGGYHFILVDSVPLLGPIIIIGKVILCLFAFIWIRATLPRIRYDRLMSFGWKVLLPLSLLAVMWSSIALVIGDAFGPVAYMIVSGVIFVAIVGGFYFVFGRDKADEDEDSDLESDPMITGERRGLAYTVLMIVGSLIAIPFGLFSATMNLLQKLAKLGDEPEEESAETTIVAIEEAEKPVS